MLHLLHLLHLFYNLYARGRSIVVYMRMCVYAYIIAFNAKGVTPPKSPKLSGVMRVFRVTEGVLQGVTPFGKLYNN